MIVSPKARRVVGDHHRLVQAATHHRRGSSSVREAGQRHLGHHLLQPIVLVRAIVSEGIGNCTIEHDLA